MAAILVRWPRCPKQTFVPPTHGGSTWNLALIGPAALVKKISENGGRTDEGRMEHAYTISSPMSLRLRWAKNRNTQHTTKCYDTFIHWLSFFPWFTRPIQMVREPSPLLILAKMNFLYAFFCHTLTKFCLTLQKTWTFDLPFQTIKVCSGVLLAIFHAQSALKMPGSTLPFLNLSSNTAYIMNWKICQRSSVRVW